MCLLKDCILNVPTQRLHTLCAYSKAAYSVCLLKSCLLLCRSHIPPAATRPHSGQWLGDGPKSTYFRSSYWGRCSHTIIVQLVLSCLRLLNVKFSWIHIVILVIIYYYSHRSSYLLAVYISLRLRSLSWGKFLSHLQVLVLSSVRLGNSPLSPLVGQPILCHKSFFPLVLVWT